MKIAVLGLGAMGTRMAANLIKAGHAITVWNRTPEAGVPLVAAGAKQAPTPAQAAHDAAFVISMVRDDEASRHVWLDAESGALAGMVQGAIAVESSTLTPDWIRGLGAAMDKHGVSLLEAPVSGSLPQAEAAQLTYLIGGDEGVLKQAEPVLRAMGSAIHPVGPLGAGALAKLTTNTLLGTQVAVLAELIGMLKRSGADVARTFEAVAATPVWSPVAQRVLGSMLAGNFTPQFPIGLIEKDFGYSLETVGSREAAPTIAAVHGVFLKAIERGLGGDNMTGVVKLFTQ